MSGGGGGGGGGGRKPVGDEAEVDALLRAAQDAVLLKLQANSHLVSSSSSSAAPLDPLDDDLARRFDALKSRPPKLPAGSAGGMEEMEGRFAALKGVAGPEKETRVRLEDLGGVESEEEDEVEKVMRWAMDAARLDVATAGNAAAGAEEEKVDDEDDKSLVSSEEDEDEERLELEKEKKSKETVGKNKNKPKNRFFFF